MKFRNLGRTVLTAALSAAIMFSLSSCVYSFTSGYLYVTGTVTSTPTGNGIITAFGIDNNTGLLTRLHGYPLNSGGANPVRAVLLPGGRFVYVLNRGLTASGGSNCTDADPCLNSNITQFVVGGNGILTSQQTFFPVGKNPVRLLLDSTGTFLFTLDQVAPSSQYCSTVSPGATSCGDISAFKIDNATGRLSPVVNAQLTATAGTDITYFPVPADPVDFVFASSSYLMTLSGAAGTPGGQLVYPYSFGTSTGQLTITQNGPQVINNGAGGLLEQGQAIIYAGGKVYILDNESLTASVNGVSTTSASQVLPFTVGTNGALQSVTGGAVQDDPNEASPIYMIVESKNKFAYVVNQQGSGVSNGAGITGYVIDPASGVLTEDAGSPWGTGANPQCLVEDPSNQYIYTANAGDSTVTGRVLSPNTGDLTLMHGSTSTFPLSGPASWCWVTGRTN